ncbi:hypothetical protein [Pseudomonas putida]|uniref:hypothetical protein n=1 Tax=Pseudomonas putida TaxID=303 RepID=UPI0039066800
MNKVENTLDKIEKLVQHRGSASEWFARAFMSWYRPSEKREIDLSEVWRLDDENLELLIALLKLRVCSLSPKERAKLTAINDYIRKTRLI